MSKENTEKNFDRAQRVIYDLRRKVGDEVLHELFDVIAEHEQERIDLLEKIVDAKRLNDICIKNLDIICSIAETAWTSEKETLGTETDLETEEDPLVSPHALALNNIARTARAVFRQLHVNRQEIPDNSLGFRHGDLPEDLMERVKKI